MCVAIEVLDIELDFLLHSDIMWESTQCQIQLSRTLMGMVGEARK